VLRAQVVDVGEMADHYGVDDLDGNRPHVNAGRYPPARFHRRPRPTADLHAPCSTQGSRPCTPSVATK
jgi:hypothetical protein